MAGELRPRVEITGIADDPALAGSGAIVPSEYNVGVKLSGGTDKQLVERSTAADGTTGLNLTSTPTVTTIVFPLTAPGATVNGAVWFEDDGTNVTLYIKRANGDVLAVVMG